MASSTTLFSQAFFKFVVGDSKEDFHVHPSLFEGLSEPLHKLINNGHLQESVERVAALPTIEPKTFGFLLDYCYSRRCRSFDHTPLRMFSAFDQPCHGLDHFSCRYCSSRCESSDCLDKFPFCSTHCRDGAQGTSEAIHWCAKCNGLVLEDKRYEPSQDALCTSCAEQQVRIPQSGQMTFTDASFTLLNLIAKPGSQAAKALDGPTNMSLDGSEASLLGLVKLYSIADMYMLSHLKDCCVHQLHLDLISLRLDETRAEEIGELMVHVYNNIPSQEGPITGHNPLRKLVSAYGVDQAKKLMCWAGFRAKVSGNTELMEDLMAGLAEMWRRYSPSAMVTDNIEL